jgi:hypothetical protein
MVWEDEGLELNSRPSTTCDLTRRGSFGAGKWKNERAESKNLQREYSCWSSSEPAHVADAESFQNSSRMALSFVSKAPQFQDETHLLLQKVFRIRFEVQQCFNASDSLRFRENSPMNQIMK